MSDSLRANVLQHSRFPCSSLSPRFVFIELVMLYNHFILCHSLLPLPLIFPESRSFPISHLFASGGQSTGASASTSVLPINESLGLISFSIDCFDLLAVKGTLRSLLQHHSSKAQFLWCLAFFMVQLSHLYMTTGKIIALTTWTFVGKVTSLLFNTLSRFVITVTICSDDTCSPKK